MTPPLQLSPLSQHLFQRGITQSKIATVKRQTARQLREQIFSVLLAGQAQRFFAEPNRVGKLMRRRMRCGEGMQDDHVLAICEIGGVLSQGKGARSVEQGWIRRGRKDPGQNLSGIHSFGPKPDTLLEGFDRFRNMFGAEQPDSKVVRCLTIVRINGERGSSVFDRVFRSTAL